MSLGYRLFLHHRLLILSVFLLLICKLGSATCLAQSPAHQSLVPSKVEGQIRIATYNVSLNRPNAGQLESDLKSSDQQARAIAAVIRLVQPDILLVNEFDYSQASDQAAIFESEYLAAREVDMLGGQPWNMPFHYSNSVNTGDPSGLDLDHDGKTDGPNDAWGFGRFPGQYGMVVFSRFQIDFSQVHTLQKFLWSKLPDALRPRAPGTSSYYDDATWQQLRLSSKSFWDVPIQTPGGLLHVLASHPTPPAFDGPEDRNGARNHDEIKLIQYYIEQASFLKDDLNQPAGLSASEAFVILGDLNSDPKDGDSRSSAVRDLLGHSRVAKYEPPKSEGARQAALVQAGANLDHLGDASQDTGDFNDRSVGNLRIDYVLPSFQFQVVRSGVFWPALESLPPEQRKAIKKCLDASDHHLVWVDVLGPD